MSTTSNRANAQSDRRAVLRSILTTGAAVATGAAIPAAGEAAGITEHADAELIAFTKRLRALNALTEAAEEAWDKTIERTELPPVPQALIATEDDSHVWPVKADQSFKGGDIELFRQVEAMAAKRTAEGRPPLQLEIPHDPRRDALIDKWPDLIAAWDQWKTDCAKSQERAGVLEAEKRCDDLRAEWRETARRIAMTPARTWSGLMAKLAVLDPYVSTPEIHKSEVATVDDVLWSVVSDAKALSQSGLAPVFWFDGEGRYA